MPKKNINAIRGDITEQKVDVIVNAANTALRPGSGVDGAIRKAAGFDKVIGLLDPFIKSGGIQTGQAIITPGGSLYAKYIIWTAGPIYKDGMHDESNKTASAYINCVKIAVEYDLRSIAFPFISTGVYGFPKQPACNIAINSIRTTLAESDHSLDVLFVLFRQEDFKLFINTLSK